MAKLKIMSIELFAPLSRKDEVVEYLQRTGTVELSEPEQTDIMSLSGYEENCAENARAAMLVRNAADILHKYCYVKKPITAMLEPRKELSLGEWMSKAEQLRSVLEKCEAVIRTEKNIAELKADAVRFQTLADSLVPWQNCDIPIISGFTKNTAVIFGSIRAKKTREEILSLLAEKLPEIDCVELDILSSDNMQTCMAVFCMKDEYEEIENVLRAEGFVRAPDCAGCTVSEKIAELTSLTEKNGEQIAAFETSLAGMSDFSEELEFAGDLLGSEHEKLNAFGKIPETSRVFYIKGYIAKRDAKRISEYCESHFDAAVEISEPSEDDDVPVLLSNNAFSAPLENITGMYSLPSGADIDPTGVMAFFYYFFFGMMLSDAGYGLIITLVCGGLLAFKRNMEQKWKNTLKMYLFCGLSTVFWGAMYGSWFGDAAKVICTEFLHKNINPLPPIWTDAVSDLMNVLIVCFIFGLVHLFTGVLLKGVGDLKNGRRFDAFCDTVPTFLTVLGIAPIFFNLFLQDEPPENYSALATFIFDAIKTVHEGLSAIATPLLAVGLVLVVATGGRSSKSIGGKIGGGLYEVYNLIGGYLGDVLSYARLLALGLATGVIAQVMNMLGTLPKSQPLKLIMFIVVFIVGHIANLAINIIGAYVHTNRLQYVEFFGKFYEGGGRAFVPLETKTQYYKFKEEN